jgi:chromosome segregation ATPase
MDTNDLKELLDKLDSNHNELSKQLNDVDKNLIKHHAELSHHIKKTEEMEEEVKKTQEDLQPVFTHVIRVEFFFKMLKWIGVPSLMAFGTLLVKCSTGN